MSLRAEPSELGRAEQAVIAALLAQLRSDAQRQEIGALASYQARFPGFESIVAAEYAAAVAATATPPLRSELTLAPGVLIGPYTIVEFLARGGQAHVYAARDARLDRTVALKVLAGAGEGVIERRARFRREAEIGAFLDHPGICPIFESGTHQGTAYLALKLVRGRTLAHLLAERVAPGDRLPSFVGWLEQVAQAVAHAHARGVIHRDLKPSNVMIGEFGETLVMDWGLAKRLADAGDDAGSAVPGELTRTPSGRSGSDLSEQGGVFGTRGYMAPEQARGDAHTADRRADVYALGAILSEILTGDPAALAERRTGAGVPARMDVDAELRELAENCLREDPRARPAGASELARRLVAYRTSIEERARNAELDAASARVRLAGERRVRRWTLACTAAIAIALGIGAWTWIDARSRELETTRAVEAQLGEALRLEERAALASSGDLEAWERAFEAARRAIAVAGAGTAGSELRERAGSVLTRIGARRAEASRAAETLAKQRAIAEGFDRLRAARSVHFTNEVSDREYTARFAELGFDGAAPESSASRAAFEAFGEPEVWIVALDDWVRVRRNLHREWRGMAEFAQAVDRDPRRQRIRESLWNENADELQAIAAAADASELASATVEFLASFLIDVKRIPAAVDLLKRAQRAHPGDFFLNGLLGHALNAQGELDEAKLYYMAAVAASPASAVGHVNLAHAHRRLEEHEEAALAAARAVELDERYAPAHNWVGTLAQLRGDLPAAIEAYRRAIECDPEWFRPRDNLGIALFQAQRYEEAEECFRAALELDDAQAGSHFGLSKALGKQGRVKEALAASERAIELHEERAAIGVEPTRLYIDHGLLLARLGRFGEALVAVRRASELAPESSSLRAEAESWIARLEAELDLAQRVDAVLSGGAAPASPEEWRALLAHCARIEFHASEAALWRRALVAHTAEELGNGARRRAAFAALRAGCGAGNDAHQLDAEERRLWRDRAREGLLEDLRRCAAEPEPAPGALRDGLQELKDEPHGDAYRGARAAELLEEEERGAWSAFWKEVQSLRK